jgi:hypothetical protein
MGSLTDHYQLQELSSGDAFSTNGQKYTTVDRATIDRLLYVGAEGHVHTGDSTIQANPTTPGSVVASTTGGTVPSGVTVYYAYTWVDDNGFETAASSTASAVMPPQVSTPGAPALAAGGSGTLIAGSYYYEVSAYTGTSSSETVASVPAFFTLSATGAITVLFPSLPSGASGFNIYRKGPGGANYLFLASVAVSAGSPASYTDNGTVAQDCNRFNPTSNTTTSTNSVVFTLPTAVPAGFVWNLYRTYSVGVWANSLLSASNAADVSSYTDIGSATTAQAPPTSTQLIATPSKIDLATETTGVLPASNVGAFPLYAVLKMNGTVTVGDVEGAWVSEFPAAQIVSARAVLPAGSSPASTPVVVDVRKGSTTSPTYASVYGSSGKPSIAVGAQMSPAAAPGNTVTLNQGDSLIAVVTQAGGGTTPTDHDLSVEIYLLVAVSGSIVSGGGGGGGGSESAPGTPTGVTATAGDTTASVAFTPADSTATSFTVTSSPGGFTGTGSSSPITVTGLTDGTAYTFTVTATNSTGTSAASAASTPVTPSSSGGGSNNPGPPTDLVATSNSDGSVTITFTAPVNPNGGGGGTFNGYEIQLANGTVVGSCTTLNGPATVNADVLSANNLVGTSQAFEMETVSYNSSTSTPYFSAESAPSNSVTIVAPPSAPGTPTGVTATAGDTTASVAFTPADSTATSFTVTSSPGGFTGTGSSSPITVTGLTDGTAYTFTVTATNSTGTSAASAASTPVTPVSGSSSTAMPVFRDVSAAVNGTGPNGTGEPQPTVPAGALAGDTLIGVCSLFSNGNYPVWPSGWTVIAAVDAGLPGQTQTYGSNMVIATKTAAAGDAGSTVELSTSTGGVFLDGTALIYATDGSVTVDTASLQSGMNVPQTPVNTYPTLPATTTSAGNELVLTFAAMSMNTGTAPEIIMTDSGTQRAGSAANGFKYTNIGIYETPAVSAGAGSAPSVTNQLPTNEYYYAWASFGVVTPPTPPPPSTPTFRDSAHSLYTTTATSVAVAVPSTFQVGDLMVLVLASAYDLPSVTGGSTTSWNETFYSQALNGAEGEARTVVLSRAMENADVGATFTLTDSNNSGSFGMGQNGVAALVAYYSSSTPVIDVQAQINDGRNSPNGGFSDTSPATGPTVTTTGTNETIVNIFNSFQMGEISGTYTSRLYVDQSSTSNASSLLIDDAVQAAAGASTPDSYTFASANSAQVITIALKA